VFCGAAAIATSIESSCNPFFIQERVGKTGELFKLFKLRTLGPINYSDLGRGDQDDRSTRIGQILRKLSLDEAPQLVHVLSGKMSIVGPRPLVPAEFDIMRVHLTQPTYDTWQNVYYAQRPGLLSSFSNVNRSFEPLSPEYYEARAELDIEDYEMASLARDISILQGSLRTGIDYAQK
jgi:lipopolysaccharide/colanic/teichoic acid biosynthesis glycosyltransferase